MKRLDQGHLHSKLEDPGLTCPGNRTRTSTVGGEHSRKELFEKLGTGTVPNIFSEHLLMSAQPVENARGKGINNVDIFADFISSYGIW